MLIQYRKGALSLALAGGSLITFAAIAPAPAAESRQEKQKAAEQLVQEALANEIDGSAERDKLLEAARQQSPDFGPAQWHLGNVRYQGHWVSSNDVPNLAEKDLRLKEYRKIRDTYAPTVEGQLALADWCAKKGLGEQERAHLTMVLEQDSDHAAARARLGFHRENNAWVQDEDVKQRQTRSATVAASIKEWRSKLEQIREGLAHRAVNARTVATEKFKAIKDPAAIPAIEAVFAGSDQETMTLVVEVLGGMKDQQSSMALARIATLNQFDSVRKAAMTELGARPYEMFVPAMLTALQTPASVKSEIVQGGRNRMIFRQEYLREGQDARERVVMETTYRRNPMPGANPRDTWNRAQEHMTATAAEREQLMNEQNASTNALNDRIVAVLASLTGINTAVSPEDWWAWWNQHNDLYVRGEKPVRETVLRNQISLSDQVAVSTGTVGAAPQSLDCLAAGTLVWTMTGPMAIEAVKIGDMVLSQDPDTGELAYKPVLRTTVRPAGQLVGIDTGREVIQTSGGHLFWTAGSGWTKARDLKSGSFLHAPQGGVRVSTVDTGKIEPTYNLVVADFHTYFTGYDKVMCHDNTLREATTAIVPGLAQK